MYNIESKKQMCNTTTETVYEFIIDTDSYAGNFERGLSEFITGIPEECLSPQMYHLMFKSAYPDIDMDEITEPKLDDEYGYRIYEMRSTPGRVCLPGSAYLQNVDGDELQDDTQCSWGSVAIFFNKDPVEYYDLLMQRAYEFTEVHAHKRLTGSQIKILGFRSSKTVMSTITTTNPLRDKYGDIYSL